MQHTLFRKETRWPGYYYRGDAMKLDDENWHVLTVSRRDPKTGEYTMEKAPCITIVGRRRVIVNNNTEGASCAPCVAKRSTLICWSFFLFDIVV